MVYRFTVLQIAHSLLKKITLGVFSYTSDCSTDITQKSPGAVIENVVRKIVDN